MTYTFEVKDPKEISLQRILAEATPDTDVIVVCGGTLLNLVFVRETFLGKFYQADNNTLAGEILHGSWGKHAAYYRAAGRDKAVTFVESSDEQTTIANEWRCRKTSSTAQEIEDEYREAIQQLHVTRTVTLHHFSQLQNDSGEQQTARAGNAGGPVLNTMFHSGGKPVNLLSNSVHNVSGGPLPVLLGTTYSGKIVKIDEDCSKIPAAFWRQLF